MNRFRLGSLIAVLASVLSIEASAQSSTANDQLVQLDFHLEKIRSNFATSRVWGGGSLMVMGGVLAIVGPLGASQYASNDGTDLRNGLTAVSLGGAALLAGTGVAVLLWKTEYENTPETYQKMPVDTPENIQRRVLYGETALQSLADQARTARYIGAGVLGVTGIGMAAASMSNRSATGQSYLYQGLLDLSLGILTAVFPSLSENENSAYRAWKANQK